MSAVRQPPNAAVAGTMILLCAIWGFQQVMIKVAAPSVSLVMQAGIRSVIACALLLAWAHVKSIPLWERDGTLGPGLAAGVLFAAEFVLIYAGLGHTTAARMIVFLYLAPPVTTLGLALFVPGERLRAVQWAGVALAFAGVVAAFAEGFVTTRGSTLLGDAFGAIAAVVWGATTVLIRATRLSNVSATKTLFYQLAVSAATMPLVSVAMGEPGVVSLAPLAVASLLYQGVIVAFASYLVWFWLLTRYLASRLAVFSFLTPLFGVLFGVMLLGDPITPAFGGAALLVAAGILLVNLPAASRASA